MIELLVRYLVPLLADILSGISFIFLVLRGHRSTAFAITTEILTSLNIPVTAQRHKEIESLVSDISEAHDLQRRTILASLVSISGTFTMLREGDLVPFVTLGIIVWLIFYYVSLQSLALPQAMARRDIKRLRARAARLFGTWWTISVLSKVAALVAFEPN